MTPGFTLLHFLVEFFRSHPTTIENFTKYAFLVALLVLLVTWLQGLRGRLLAVFYGKARYTPDLLRMEVGSAVVALLCFWGVIYLLFFHDPT